jgi:uncharacterized membrane protein
MRPWRSPGILLGIGLGGFVDGIVLHQILQWHNMLSARIPPTTMEAMRTNMTADGLFHAATWLVTLVGVARLWRAGMDGALPGGRALFADGLVGWGIFNLVEGLVNHELLGIHHVREVPEWLYWDIGFLAIGGAGLIALGLALGRSASGAYGPSASYHRRSL